MRWQFIRALGLQPRGGLLLTGNDIARWCLECRDQFSYARKLSRLLIAKAALRTWPMPKDGGNGEDLRVTDLSRGKLIAFLNWSRQRIGEIVDVTVIVKKWEGSENSRATD